MDHKNFETEMFDVVNLHSQAKTYIANDKSCEEQETLSQRRRKRLIESVIEYIIWVVALLGVVLVMAFACQFNFIPAKVAILASSLFAFIAGMRINTLAKRIARYGGR
jgi:hypothetical protein